MNNQIVICYLLHQLLNKLYSEYNYFLDFQGKVDDDKETLTKVEHQTGKSMNYTFLFTQEYLQHPPNYYSKAFLHCIVQI